MRCRRNRGNPFKIGINGGLVWRLILAGSAVALGIVSVSHSIALAIANADPSTAYEIAPYDGQIAASLALQEISFSQQVGANNPTLELSQKALRFEPLASDALSTIALAEQLGNNPDKAQDIFEYVFLLSRRDRQAQLWAIERNVERGDISGALQNYDLALSTSSKTQRILFPILASAISEPKVRSELLVRMKDRPVWIDAFIIFLVNHSIDPEATIALFLEGQKVDLPVSDTHRSMAVNGLAAKAKLDAAWEYYASFHKKSSRDVSRDPKFELAPDFPSVFDWNVSDTPPISAQIVRDAQDGGSAIEFSVPPVIGGMIASQTQVLSPGQYRLLGSARNLQPANEELLYWTLTCIDGRELARVEISGANEGDFKDAFSVPKDCPGQKLSLLAQPTNQILGISGKIIEARIVRN